MQGCLYDWVPLVVLLHQHFKTTERDAKHLRELERVHSVPLRLEHAWLLFLDPLEFLNFAVVSAHAFYLDLPLLFLVFDILFWEFLPLIVHLLVDQSICLLKELTNPIVGSELDVHLHADELLHYANLGLKGIDLGPI